MLVCCIWVISRFLPWVRTATACLRRPDSYLVINFLGGTGITFWQGLVVAVIVGALMGALFGVPILRTRGDYLAIVTLGFGQITFLLLLNLRDYTGGPGGVLDIPPPTLFGVDLGSAKSILYLGMIMLAIVAFMTLRLNDSRIGRSWRAMKEDEDVASTMGINLSTTKLVAFAIGAAFASAAGVLYATRQVNIFPDNFALKQSIDILSLVIIGGLGSIEGVVSGRGGVRWFARDFARGGELPHCRIWRVAGGDDDFASTGVVAAAGR